MAFERLATLDLELPNIGVNVISGMAIDWANGKLFCANYDTSDDKSHVMLIDVETFTKSVDNARVGYEALSIDNIGTLQFDRFSGYLYAYLKTSSSHVWVQLDPDTLNIDAWTGATSYAIAGHGAAVAVIDEAMDEEYLSSLFFSITSPRWDGTELRVNKAITTIYNMLTGEWDPSFSIVDTNIIDTVDTANGTFGYNNLICVGNFLYVIYRQATPVVVYLLKISKVDLSIVDQLVIPAYSTQSHAMAYSSYDEKLYVGYNSTSNKDARVAQIDIGSFTITEIISTPFNSAEGYVYPMGIDNYNGYLYVGLQSAGLKDRFKKISLDDFSLVGTVEVDSTAENITSPTAAMQYDPIDGVIYAPISVTGTGAGSGPMIIKLRADVGITPNVARNSLHRPNKPYNFNISNSR